MPREGISRDQVHEARDSLVQQGRRPSVEAVRAVLGNTGSNTTISRYLKELNASNPIAPPLPRNHDLGTLVSSITQRLLQDTETRLAEGRAALAAQRDAHQLERTHHLELTSSLQQSVWRLTNLLHEADTRYQALELEHERYRNAALLQHDQQVQELQQQLMNLESRLKDQQQALGGSQNHAKMLQQDCVLLRERLRQQLILVRRMSKSLNQREAQISELQNVLERLVPASMA